MAFKVASRLVFGFGAYQVVSPTGVVGGGGTPTDAFLAFQLGRHMGNWR